MRHTIFVLMLIASTSLLGQSFQEKFKLVMPQFDEMVNLQWADVDSDSLLDAVVAYKFQGEFKVVAFQNGNAPWPMRELISIPYAQDMNFQIIDFNKDDKLDVVVTNGNQFGVQPFDNSGNFVFQPSSSWGNNQTIKQLQYVDVNNDAKWDTVWTDGAKLHVGNKKDTVLNKVESFLVVDMDFNGYRDILFSGLDANNAPITYCWYLGDRYKILKRAFLADVAGKLNVGHLNTDSLFDLVITGKNSAGDLVTVSLDNQGRHFDASAFGLLSGMDAEANALLADFNADGLTQTHQFGKLQNGTKLNLITNSVGITKTLDADILSQAFGDYDRDGDLDLSVAKTDALYIYASETIGNKGPEIPFNAIAIKVFGRIFFWWHKPNDDHTPRPSITYDLKVFSTTTQVLPANFSDGHYQRPTVNHGNMGTKNFALLRIPSTGFFQIQSVDNSFARKLDGKKICQGNLPGNGGPCSNFNVQYITACGEAPVPLTPIAPQAMWFSFSDGFMGVGDSFNANAKTDTVFAFNPEMSPCDGLRVFVIKKLSTDPILISHVSYRCEDSDVKLSVELGWSNVHWSNNLNANVVSSQTLDHQFTKPIIFKAEASNEYGCTLQETFDLRLSKPNLQLPGTHFQIVKGNSVELGASGGDSYLWSPATSLSSPSIANPIASPALTTEYQVTVLDSLGCSAAGTVLVEVLEEAFIPTMFTPNGDSRNDRLKIYGLTQASDFHFEIYNREGAKLFETSSIVEATQAGWNGQVNGIAQPPGTYYWKVEGRMARGEVLLNGKKKGAFLLVR